MDEMTGAKTYSKGEKIDQEGIYEKKYQSISAAVSPAGSSQGHHKKAKIPTVALPSKESSLRSSMQVTK